MAPTGAIDWYATLLLQPRATRADIRRRPRRLARGGRWVIALDCSASMLDSGALAVAKGVAQSLVARAARSSARLALVSFGGDDVHARARFDLGNGAVERAIADLGAAGGTPLGRAIQLGLELAKRTRADSVERRLFLFTDGRTREDVTAAAHPDVDITLIDCELGRLRLGRVRRLAVALRATYVHIESLMSEPSASEPGALEHGSAPEPRTPP